MSAPVTEPDISDHWIVEFLRHLAGDRGASVYTQRNYRQTLLEFFKWYSNERKSAPDWAKLERDDFRSYLRYLGRSNFSRAAIQLRFSALRTYYKFLIRRGVLQNTPIKNLAMPKLEKRLPQFLTKDQLLTLLDAPIKELATEKDRAAQEKPPRKVHAAPFLRDVAILETIYSCGLRISELCGLNAEDIDWPEQLVRVRGKGQKERVVPIGEPALKAIETYWKELGDTPTKDAPVFYTDSGKDVIYPRWIQMQLKKYLMAAQLDPTLTPHKLRHSYATHMLDAGADLRSVQELLGHAHLVTTQIYTHLTMDRLKKAYNSAHPRAQDDIDK
jgi:integrase/recombinase XerC